MLPRLFSFLTALLSVGVLAMDTFVRVRKIFWTRKGLELTVVERRRYKELLPLYPELLTREQQDEFLDLENRLLYSEE